MSTDQTIFGSQPNPGNQSQPSTPAGGNANQDNPLATLLASIKNEHGVQKFQSIEDLVNGYNASQQFITTLKGEKSEQQRQAEEATRIAQEAASKLASQQELQRTIDELTRKVNQEPTSSGVKPEDIAALVKNVLNADKVESTSKANTAKVVAALQAKYGDKAEEIYNSGAAANGFSVADFNSLVGKNPEAVLKLLGADASHKPQTFAPGGSSVNTAALTPAVNSMIKRNDAVLEIGATTAQLNEEAQRARQLVEELHSQGRTIDDLTKPSVFFKYFK